MGTIWPAIRDYIYSLIMGASACDHHFLMERSIVGLLRLAIRLMLREDMSPVVSFLLPIRVSNFKFIAIIPGAAISEDAASVEVADVAPSVPADQFWVVRVAQDKRI